MKTVEHRGAGRALHRGDARGHRRRQPPGAPGARPLARRAGAADAAAAAGARRDGGRGVREQRRDRPSDFRFTRASGARAHGLEQHPGPRASRSAWWSSSTCIVAPRQRGPGLRLRALYDGQGKDGQPFLAGLIDVEALGQAYDGDLPASEARLSGSDSAAGFGPLSGGVGPSDCDRARAGAANPFRRSETPKTHISGATVAGARRRPAPRGAAVLARPLARAPPPKRCRLIPPSRRADDPEGIAALMRRLPGVDARPELLRGAPCEAASTTSSASRLVRRALAHSARARSRSPSSSAISAGCSTTAARTGRR